MISLNQKTLQKPSGLYRNHFLSQLYTEALERKIVNSQTDLTSYKIATTSIYDADDCYYYLLLLLLLLLVLVLS